MNTKILLLAFATLLPIGAHAMPTVGQAPFAVAYADALRVDTPSIFLAKRDVQPRQGGQFCTESAAFVVTDQPGAPMISLVRLDVSPRSEPQSYVCSAPSVN